MRLKGSVLIVVLGLLAVLAVVGIAFVTMSSIESNTASNFALQAQFDLAADGAVDYVCQALIRDIWEFVTDSTAPVADYRTYNGYMLTGRYGTWPWDFPVTTLSVDPKPTQDLFLASSWSSTTVLPTNVAYSFRAATPTLKPYYLNTWGGGSAGNTPIIGTGIPGSGTDGSPNNLGIPDIDKSIKWYTPQNGLWIPELAFPYENGIIRVSVTVQDHAAMVNLNAHGSPQYDASNSWSPYGKAAGKGYFVCDVTPAGQSWLSSLTDITGLLNGTGTPPGRYGTDRTPGNKRLGEIFIQNPAIDTGAGTSGSEDRPFTLDDEFELRRLNGTYAKSRLEQIIGTSLDSAPNTTTAGRVAARMGLTTVGWNAEVIPAVQNTCIPKCDINLNITGATGITSVTSALGYGVLDPSTSSNTINQFAANVRAFKDRYIPPSGSSYFKSYDGGKYGARRQAILSKVKVNVTRNSSTGKDRWDVHFQVFNPWYGNYAGDTAKLGAIDTTGHQVKVYLNSAVVKTFEVGGTTRSVPYRGVWDNALAGGVTTFEDTAGKSLTKITLEVPGLCIDQITSADLGSAYPTVKRRPFGVYDEPRTTDDTEGIACKVTVLYLKGWNVTGVTADDTTWGTREGTNKEIAEGNGIPIRFPHSVPMDDPTGKADWDTTKNGPLPPYYNATDTTAKLGIFKAFLRVGDLNQVLCPATELEATTDYWPWITRVADKSGITGVTTAPTLLEEQAVKWDWWKTGGAPVEKNDAYDINGTVFLYNSTTSVRQYRRYNGANVFCVDSPWADSYDNDGDGSKDFLEETAIDKARGRFCGQEIRVAGRINLNTATDQALRALGMGFPGLTNESTYTAIATNPSNRPLRSPAEIIGISSITATPSDTPYKFMGGPLEKRDYPYTLISNIATVRSDTFSIYGTVQFLLPPGREETAATNLLSKIKIVRTRRFWALVDRSPVFNAKPGLSSFVRPRIMNFQWLD
jgi:hypothetical protein